MWYQKTFRLPAFGRGFHIITKEVKAELEPISKVKVGICHIFIHHSTCSLTINEQTDPTVRVDFESHFNSMVPQDAPHFKHTSDQPDNMPAHLKSSILGSSVTVPITNGKLALGTWQGIYLCEHRTIPPSNRKITITVWGE
ncbi:MAG: secondary thiamine-phosphate synthase enzyme YjbQ [Cytophagales bacterium]|nr:secondary thiamine-phosphate synthase enzyme YjbQ [Cytophagales bacterium]